MTSALESAQVLFSLRNVPICPHVLLQPEPERKGVMPEESDLLPHRTALGFSIALSARALMDFTKKKGD